MPAHFKQTAFCCELGLFQQNGDSNCKIGLSVSYQMVVYHSNFGIQWGVSTQTKDS